LLLRDVWLAGWPRALWLSVALFFVFGDGSDIRNKTTPPGLLVSVN